jgi:hypothetical protein
LGVDLSTGGGGWHRHVLQQRERGPGGAIARVGGSLEHADQGAPVHQTRRGKKAKQRGDHGGAHLGQQMARWAAVVAHGGGAAPSSSGDGGGSMRGSSGSKKTLGSFMATSSSSSQLQLRRGALNWWHTAVARVWFLWLKLQGK